jgi:hypothetical protein
MTMLETAQFAEFASAVVRQLPRDLDPTTAQGWIQNQKALADILRKSLKPETESVAIQVSDDANNPLMPPYEGWELVDGSAGPTGTLELELAEFLKQGEDYVKGDVMLERAKKSGPMLGERQARALFEQQERIPETWRKFYLVFPRTVWRDRGGRLMVPYLGWYGRGWRLHFDWLGYDFRRHVRIASLRK